MVQLFVVLFGFMVATIIFGFNIWAKIRDGISQIQR